MSQKLVDIRCACGKLLGKVEEGAAYSLKCQRCKKVQHGTTVTLGGLPFHMVVDPSLKDEIHFVSRGKFVGKIVNVV